MGRRGRRDKETSVSFASFALREQMKDAGSDRLRNRVEGYYRMDRILISRVEDLSTSQRQHTFGDFSHAVASGERECVGDRRLHT